MWCVDAPNALSNPKRRVKHFRVPGLLGAAHWYLPPACMEMREPDQAPHAQGGDDRKDTAGTLQVRVSWHKTSYAPSDTQRKSAAFL